MSMDSLDGPGRSSSPSPTSQSPVQEVPEEGVHLHRSVSTETSPKRIFPSLSQGENTHFKPLSHRGLAAKRFKQVKNSKLVDFITSVAMPTAVKGLNEKPRKELKKLRAGIKAMDARFRSDSKQLKSVEKELGKIEEKLIKLQARSDSLNPKEFKALIKAIKRKAELIPMLCELEVAVSHYDVESKSVRDIEQKLVHQRDKTESLLGAALKSGARFLTGLQKIYAAKVNPANADTPYQLNLGGMTLTDEGHYDIQLNDITVLIDKCHMDGEKFVISVTECSAMCRSKGQKSAATGPVELAGKFTVTFKPPLAQAMQDIMTCPTHELPRKIKQRWQAFRANNFNPDAEGRTPKLLDFVDLSLDGISQKQGDGYFDLLNQSGGELMLKLLTPVISSYKEYADEAVISGLDYQILHLRKKTDQEESLRRKLSDFKTQLQDHLNDFPEESGHDYKELQGVLNKVRSDLDEAVEQDVRFQKAKSVEQDRLTVAKSIAQGRDGWLEGFDNMVLVMSSLRKAMEHATEDNPTTVEIKPQKIRLGTAGYIDLENLQVDVTDVEMTDDGVLTITAPTASAKMIVGRELSDTTSANMKLSGLKLTLSPPLGTLAWEVMNLKFPITAGHFNSLKKEFDNLTQISDDETEAPHVTLKDLIRFQLDGVTEVNDSSDAGMEPSAIASEPDTAKLADEVSALAGVEVDEDGLQTFLGDYVTMTDGSQREVKNLLSMALLGLGHVASVTPKNKKSIRRVASEINSPVRPLQEDWVMVSDSDLSGVATESEHSLEPEVDEGVTVVSPEHFTEAVEKVDQGDLDDDEFEDALDEPYDPSQELTSEPVSVHATLEPVEVEGKGVSKSIEVENIEKPEVVEQKQVQDLIDLKASYVEGDPGKNAVFEANTDLLSLVGQLKGFAKWLVGKDTKDVLTVTTPVDERGVVLVNPKIRSKKGGFIRRYFVNRMLRKALKERSMKTVIGLSEDQSSLVLKPWQPIDIPPGESVR